MAVNVYFDTEFTGLVENTTLISIGCVSEDGKKFYGEFTDYDKNLVDDWIQENVIDNLKFNNRDSFVEFNIDINTGDVTTCVKGKSDEIKEVLTDWIKDVSNDESVQFVSDVSHYDFYLLCNLFGGAFSLPDDVVPACYDINQDIANWILTSDGYYSDWLHITDCMNEAFTVSREELCRKFNKELPSGDKHNSLYDAEVIKLIYDGMIDRGLV